MPSRDTYKKMLGGSSTTGQARKRDSEVLMNANWWDDIAAKRAYIYDYYHDDEPLDFINLHPEKSKSKTPIDIKYVINAYNSENKDQVGYHLQFRPGQECPLDYYKEFFIDKYSAEFPIGLFVDIPDNKGMYRKWLITENANWLDLEFPTWYILPIDHVFQWIHKGAKYQMCGVSRSQSSYNSGVWEAYKTTSTENQRKCILPMNEISATIFYDTRIILSAPIDEPVAWKCTKVEQTAPKGSNRLTFAQDLWNDHADAFEYEDGEVTSIYRPDKKVIGMYADYYKSEITPTDPEDNLPSPTEYSVISYSGIKPEIKVGGNYKTFTVKFFNNNNEEINFQSGTWSFEYYNKKDNVRNDASMLVETSIDDLEPNELDVKFIGKDSHINDILVVIYESYDGIKSEVEMEIVGL